MLLGHFPVSLSVVLNHETDLGALNAFELHASSFLSPSEARTYCFSNPVKLSPEMYDSPSDEFATFLPKDQAIILMLAYQL